MHIADVHIPPNQELRITIANRIIGNKGGEVQFEILVPNGKLPKNWFTNARILK